VLGSVMMSGVAIAISSTGAMVQGMPSPLWRGVSRIVLSCSAGLDAKLCAAIRNAARVHTAIPVELATGVAPTDRATVILTITPADDGRSLVALAHRAVEIDEAEGPARYVVAWDATAPGAAVDDLLTRILPHRFVEGRRSK
jgi:hypothetical protein